MTTRDLFDMYAKDSSNIRTMVPQVELYSHQQLDKTIYQIDEEVPWVREGVDGTIVNANVDNDDIDIEDCDQERCSYNLWFFFFFAIYVTVIYKVNILTNFFQLHIFLGYVELLIDIFLLSFLKICRSLWHQKEKEVKIRLTYFNGLVKSP